MKPLHGFFIKPLGNRYNNTVKVEDKDLIVNTEVTERDFEFVNREAEIISLPRNYSGPLREGFKILVHHNIFRRWYDMRGQERNSGSYIDEDLYIVYEDQVYAYHDTEWKSLNGYTFVYPIENDDEWDTNIEKPLYGKTLEGDTVGFTPNSEYEFTMDGKKVYRILSNQITWTLNKKENK